MRIKDEHKETVIREKAIQIIASVGFEGLSMHKLAKAADVSPNTIYIYYKNKEDLLLSVFEQVSNTVAVETLKGFDAEMSLEEGVKKLWMNRYRYFMKHPDHMFLMEHFSNSALSDKAGGAAYTLFNSVMTTFLTNATRNGQLIKMPVETYWAIAFAPLFQLLKFHFRNKTIEQKSYMLTEKKVMEACQIVLRALQP